MGHQDEKSVGEHTRGLGERTGSPQGLRVVGIGRRSPELTGHAGPIWRVQLGQGGGPGPGCQKDKKAGAGKQGDREGPIVRWEVMGLQMVPLFLSMFFSST